MHFSYSCTQSTTIHDLCDMQDEKKQKKFLYTQPPWSGNMKVASKTKHCQWALEQCFAVLKMMMKMMDDHN